MKIFLDTANLDEIREGAALGVVDGVTTNPSLMAKEDGDYKEMLKEICDIVREEQNRAGALEVLMPTSQPADLWRKSGPYDAYGKEMLRIKDRHDRDYVVQPTSEEVVTDVARQELRSYKQLPVNFYLFYTKFRDEIRPRFGVMRAREFLM